jgi:hypothetical protein
MDDYAAARIAMIRAGGHPPLQLRYADGRILKTECIELPDGGRMLTFVDLASPIEQSSPFAPIDRLTKLPSRDQFFVCLVEEFARASKHDLPLSVTVVDADHFKRINDQHGRRTGDEVLQTLAARLQHRMRRGDILGRVGGGIRGGIAGGRHCLGDRCGGTRASRNSVRAFQDRQSARARNGQHRRGREAGRSDGPRQTAASR